MNAIKTSNFILEDNKLKATLKFEVDHSAAAENSRKGTNNISKISTAGGLVSLRVQTDVHDMSKNYKVYITLKLEKCYLNDSVDYELKVSGKLSIISPSQPYLYYRSPGSDWKFDKCMYITTCNIMDCLLCTYDRSEAKTYADIIIELNVKTSPKFSSMLDDTELTDIELIGDDGSVALHRLVLASHSPVMKTMLTGEWKETKDGRVNVPGLSMQALEHLKNYFYMGDLPNATSELDPLLEFACRYMMTDLVQLCTTKILFKVTSDNAMHFLELAMKYRIKKLLYGILKLNQENGFNLQNLLSSYCGNEWIL